MGDAGAPVVLGPPGSSGKPVVLGPPGSSGKPTTASPPPVSSTKAPSKSVPEPSSKPSFKPASASPAAAASSGSAPSPGKSTSEATSKDKEAASKANAVPTGSAASASPPTIKEPPSIASSGDSASATRLAPGTYARIFGIQSAQHLNGKLCQVVRPGETPDRTVTRVGNLGEKALKQANLAMGAAVYPKNTIKLAGILLSVMLLALADVCRTRGYSELSAAAIPIIAAVVLTGTLGVCVSVWWRCMPEGKWGFAAGFPPSVSELSANAPIHHVYRFGFLAFAVLFTATIALYQEILLPNVVIPTPPVAAPSPPPIIVTATAPGPVEVESAAEVAEAVENTTGDATDNTSVNATQNFPRRMPEFGPSRSLTWGYAAAAGVGVQAIFSFDGKWNVRSVLHVTGMLVFAAGVMQHSSQSNFWLGLPRGEDQPEAPAILVSVLQMRRSIAEYGPLVLMLGPLSSQLLGSSRSSRYNNQSPSMRSMYADSGMGKAIALTQWALMVLVAVFYSSFAFDFWLAAANPPAKVAA